MRVAVTSMGPSLDDLVDTRFGRSRYFVIVDSETMAAEGVPNPAASAAGGAGPQTAQFVIDRGVQAVVTGQIGPHAAAPLEAAHIQCYSTAGGSVREAVERLKAGRLQPIGPEDAAFGGRGPGGWRAS